MDAREEIIQLHKDFGLECVPFDIVAETHSIETDCEAVITGLEQSIENLNAILNMTDSNNTEHALCEELAFIIQESGKMLYKHLHDMN